ncbi:MAG: hypothetical protein MUC87_10835 [Bacteroidia bacterium]|jgi:hypothetical protein|nr:hypothetical protein [Bacteroidia bacterium]
MPETAPPFRALVTDSSQHTEISIPVKTNWPFVLLQVVSLSAAIFSVYLTSYFFIAENNAPPQWIGVLWGLIWTALSLIQFRFLLWIIWGKEFITVTSTEITQEKKGSLFGSRKKYRHTSNQDFTTHNDSRSADMSYIFSRYRSYSKTAGWFRLGITGSIHFTHQGKTVKIAAGISQHEAEAILQHLRQRGFIR